MQQSTNNSTEMLCPRCFAQLNAQGRCSVCGYNVVETGVLDQNKLAPATVLKDRYYIGLPLGQGGFGITYLSYDLVLNTKLAIKEYYPSGIATRVEGSKTVTNISQKDLADFREGLEKFLGEARMLAKFSEHQNIVSVRDYFEYNGTAYMVMGYLEGQTLLQYLDSCGGKLSFADTCRFMFPIMEALNAVHASGLIHRDISPDNVFLTNDGSVKLLDFGAAKSALSLVAQQKHSIVLKKGYSPSEQYREDGKLGPWTDVYSLGATFYRCLTGEVPQDSIDRLFNDKVLELKIKAKDTPNYAIDAILKAMSLNEIDRFQNMLDFKEALSQNTKTTVDSQPKKSPKIEQAQIAKQRAAVKPKLSAVTPNVLKRGNKIIAFAAVIVMLFVVCGVVLFNIVFKSGDNEATIVAEQKTVATEQKTVGVKKTEKTQEKPVVIANKNTPVPQSHMTKNETAEKVKPREKQNIEKKAFVPKKQKPQATRNKSIMKDGTHNAPIKAVKAAKESQPATKSPVLKQKVVTTTVADIKKSDAQKRREENMRKLQQEQASERGKQPNTAAEAAKKRREENLRKMQSANVTENSQQNSVGDAAKRRREENLRKLQQEK